MAQIAKDSNIITQSYEKLSAIFENSSEKISHKTKLFIEKIISELPDEDKTDVFINQLLQDIRANKDYFDDALISNLIKTITITGIDVSNMIKLLVSDGTMDDYFGYSVAVSNTKIVIGTPGNGDKVSNPGSAYIYDLDGTNEIKLTASDGSSSDYFGRSVAISDNKIVIGAYIDDDKVSNPGSAYIYDLDGTNEIKLTASDGTVNDYFGYSVAVSNTKIVIGSFFDDDKGSNPGSAYIYDLDGTNEIKLTASDGSASDYFGSSVAVSNTKIVIGAWSDNDKGSGSGSAYIYDLDGTNEIKLTASDGTVNDYFGYSVAVSDTKIVIGAYRDDDKGTDSGSVYIYDLDGTNEIKLVPNDGADTYYFGYSVAVSDTKIVIGALDSAYIYDLNGTNEIKLTSSDGATNNNFGCSVTVSDTKVVIGAPDDNGNGPSSGSAYIYG